MQQERNSSDVEIFELARLVADHGSPGEAVVRALPRLAVSNLERGHKAAIVNALLLDDRFAVRAAAAHAACLMGDGRTQELLLQLLSDNGDDGIRRAALLSLARLLDPDSLRLLINSQMQNAPAQRRLDLLQAGRSLRRGEYLLLLRRALHQDEDERVRYEAALSLAFIEVGDARTELTSRFEHGRFQSAADRILLTCALAKLRDRQALCDLIDMIRRYPELPPNDSALLYGFLFRRMGFAPREREHVFAEALRWAESEMRHLEPSI